MLRKNTVLSAVTGLTAATLIGGVAAAANITVANGSFGTPTTTSYNAIFSNSQAVSPNNDYVTPANASNGFGWGAVMQSANTTGNEGYWSIGNQTLANGGLTGGSGGYAGFVNGGTNLIYQDLGAISPNTTYTLTVNVAQPQSGDFGNNTADMATIALMDGQVVTSSASASFQTGSGTSYASFPPSSSDSEIASSTFAPAVSTLTSETVSLTTGATATGDLTVILENSTPVVDSTGATIQSQVSFNNVQVTASSVPAPATGLLAAVGIGSVVLLGRRRKMTNQA